MKGFLTEIGRRSQDAAYVVVAADNETAIALYRRAGFDPVEAVRVAPGTESLLMQWAAAAHSEDVTAEVLLVAAGALCVTAVAVPVCIVVAHRFGVMDRPGPLKTQETPVPYLGGVAVFAGLVVGGSVGRPIVLVPLAAASPSGSATTASGFPHPCGWRPNSEWERSSR